MPPKTIYSYNAIPIKIPVTYFTDLEKIFQTFIWIRKRPHIATTTLEKKNKIEGITLPNIKLYCKAILIKIKWY